MRLLLAAILSLAAAALSAETATVSATSANVRAGAGTTHAVVGTLRRGTAVEVLETAGDWVRVRASDGLEGWVSARLLQRAAAPASPAAPAAARPTERPPSDRAGVAIEHREVSCLIADQFARVEACASPADKVARAQVHFRASETGPWYSVDMRPEGSCLAAVLPKPKTTTKHVQYFIYTLDRAFAESARPEGAPGAAFRPRVVGAKSECGEGLLGSLGPGAVREVVVNIARSPAGKILETGATALGSPAQVAGFSSEGIIAGQPAAGGPSASSGAGQAAAAGGAAGAAAAGGLGTPVIVAGGLGAAVVVGGVVVATGGGGDGAEDVSLTGNWTGSLTTSFNAEGFACFANQDIQVTFTHTGNTVTGPVRSVLRELRCNLPDSGFFSSLVGEAGSGMASGTLSPPNGIRFDLGEGRVWTGTYTATAIDVAGRWIIEGLAVDDVMSLVKSR